MNAGVRRTDYIQDSVHTHIHTYIDALYILEEGCALKCFRCSMLLLCAVFLGDGLSRFFFTWVLGSLVVFTPNY